MKMIGYAEIDCKGLDLTSQSTQTVSGLYKKMGTVLKNGYAAFATNCVYGDLGIVSPIAVMINDNGIGTAYIATASILQISVDKEDHVVITSLLA